MLMEDFKISLDIYQKSLSVSSFKISDDIYEETEKLTIDGIKKELEASYRFSGRFWIWKLGVTSYAMNWKRMFEANEMQMDAPGFKYFLSYQTISDFQEEYARKHPDRNGITTVPFAYYAFAKSLHRGDVVIVCGVSTNIIAWGIVEGAYMFRATRKVGRHCRKVSWTKMDMPFIFTNKRQILYQIPVDETHQLEKTLINKTFQRSNVLPFGFVDSGYEMEIPFINEDIGCNSDRIREHIGKDSHNLEQIKKDVISKIVTALRGSF